MGIYPSRLIGGRLNRFATLRYPAGGQRRPRFARSGYQ